MAHLYQYMTGCTLTEAIAATVRPDADALDGLYEFEREGWGVDLMPQLAALQRILAQRVRDLDEGVDVEAWSKALYEAKDDEALLGRLRAVV